jgi:hypothetical protein
MLGESVHSASNAFTSILVSATNARCSAMASVTRTVHAHRSLAERIDRRFRRHRDRFGSRRSSEPVALRQAHADPTDPQNL